MQTILGFYDKGILKLDKEAPVNKLRVIVMFTEEEPSKKYLLTTPYVFFINTPEV